MIFDGLVPQLREPATKLYGFIRERDATARVTSVRRTRSQQARLHRAYLRGESKFPAAAPGTSDHELGLAFDVVARDAVLREAGKLWESWGGEWGGRYDDPIHFGVRP